MLKNIFLLAYILSILREGESDSCATGVACTALCKFTRGATVNKWDDPAPVCDDSGAKQKPTCEGIEPSNFCWCKPGADACNPSSACKTDAACLASRNCKGSGAACGDGELCKFKRSAGAWAVVGAGCDKKEAPTCTGINNDDLCWCTPGAEGCGADQDCKSDDGCKKLKPRCKAGADPCADGQLCKFEKKAGGWELVESVGDSAKGCENKAGPTCEGIEVGKFCWCTPGNNGCNPSTACKSDDACKAAMKKNTNMRIAPSLISFLVVVVFGLSA